MSESTKWVVREALGPLELQSVLNQLEAERYEVFSVASGPDAGYFVVTARKRGI